MKKDDIILLKEIAYSIKLIESFCRGISNQNFFRNALIQSATVRQFEIIGEAINHLSTNFREKHSDINWSRAVSFRNVLIHGYREVDYRLVWQTIQEDLPILKKQIKKILRDFKE